MAAPDVVTSYTYDSAGRLNRVSTPGSGVTQVRTFTYDNRGFLLSETHPEKVGAVTYSGYDARGHVGQKVDGPNTLNYTYDRAERLTELREANQGNRLLKSMTYATSNAGCGWCNGKLSQASRWNYVTIGSTPYTVEIRESLQYNGVEGRASNRTTENYIGGANLPSEAFTFSQTYTPLGFPLKVTYPQCQHGACTNRAPRTADFSYTDGQLTAVAGTVGTAPPVPTTYASAITYHVNGMVHQVVHQNSSAVTVTDTTALDPANGMARPASITAFRGTTSLWNTGNYSYDGAGNIKRIGPSYFTYDKVSRLTASSVNISQGVSAPQFKDQSYAFDAFGNIQSITTNETTVYTPTASATNRLDVPSVYNTAGDLTTWQGNTYEYDALNMMRRYRTAAALEWAYIYNVDDERVWTYKTGGTESRWFLRGFDAKVLREYAASSSWQVANDYIYRGNQLLASETPAGVRHFHLDHLGTPRLITDLNGIKKAFHAYFPFGQEATVVDQDAERMKFTGHERDLGNPASDADDLDYMHARYFSPAIARFIETDPSSTSAVASMPQSWNRYAYTHGNPLKFLDPDGRSPQWFQFGLYKVMLDLLNHGGAHWDVYMTNGARIGRMGLDGTPIAHMGKTPSIPRTLIKAMTKAGLIVGTAVVMFFEPSAAGAAGDDAAFDALMAGSAKELADIKKHAKEMYGISDVQQLTKDQWTAIQDQRKKEKEKKEKKAEGALADLTNGGCSYHGGCAPQ